MHPVHLLNVTKRRQDKIQVLYLFFHTPDTSQVSGLLPELCNWAQEFLHLCTPPTDMLRLLACTAVGTEHTLHPDTWSCASFCHTMFKSAIAPSPAQIPTCNCCDVRCRLLARLLCFRKQLYAPCWSALLQIMSASELFISATEYFIQSHYIIHLLLSSSSFHSCHCSPLLSFHSPSYDQWHNWNCLSLERHTSAFHFSGEYKYIHTKYLDKNFNCMWIKGYHIIYFTQIYAKHSPAYP